MTTRCMIVDDEPLAIKLIENHITQIESLEIVATCNSGIKAINILKDTEVDLLFLDIKMPGITGIDLLKTLKNPPKTIFTTAYRDHAIESYELDIVDYLLKPIVFPRFFKAIERYKRMKNEEGAIISSNTNPSAVSSFLVVKSGTKHHKILTDNILYIESMKDYIKIYLKDEKRIVTKYKISDITEKLSNQSFLRIHRSFIVNMNKVTAFTTHDVEIGTIEIPIGGSYKKMVLTYLEGLKK